MIDGFGLLLVKALNIHFFKNEIEKKAVTDFSIKAKATSEFSLTPQIGVWDFS